MAKACYVHDFLDYILSGLYQSIFTYVPEWPPTAEVLDYLRHLGTLLFVPRSQDSSEYPSNPENQFNHAHDTDSCEEPQSSSCTKCKKVTNLHAKIVHD